VVTIGGLSAHAGQDMLVKYATVEKGLKGIILIHGEQDAETLFRAKLAQVGLNMVIYPDLFTSIDL